MLLLLGCFSGLEDLNCKENNTNSENDMIFWRRQCYRIGDICAESGLTGLNASYCVNSTGSYIPMNRVINRTLASEEYYK